MNRPVRMTLSNRGALVWIGAVCLVGVIVGCGGQSGSHRNTGGGSSSAAGGSSSAGSTSAGGRAGGASEGGGAAAGTAASSAGTSPGGGTIVLPHADPDKQPQCFQEPEAGNCAEPETRYYYDPAKKSCQPFEYSGCDGNDNNFETRSRCTDFCFGFRGCSCDESQPDCKVVGACSECPVDLSIADGKACESVGLICGGGGSCRCQKSTGDADPTWQCTFKP